MTAWAAQYMLMNQACMQVFQDSLAFAQRFSQGVNEAKAAQIRK